MKAQTFISVLTLVAWLLPAGSAAPSGRVAMTEKRRLALMEDAKKMWSHGFDNYMTFAYPADEIKPITCKGQGRDPNPANYARNDVNPNAALTHLDSLSTIRIFKSDREFVQHIDLVLQPGRTEWDQDIKVQVFEVTIRVLGSLLSSYQQLEEIERKEWQAKYQKVTEGGESTGWAPKRRDVTGILGEGSLGHWSGWLASLKTLAGLGSDGPQMNGTYGRSHGYGNSQRCDSTDPLNGAVTCTQRGAVHMPAPETSNISLPYERSDRAKALLELALDLGRRLLPAFDTPTGIPYARVNLRHGIDKATETTETCAAAAGSLVLEFTLLSRLTGDDRFETVARRALFAVWQRRSAAGLIGSSIEVNNGNWLLGTSTIGAGVDSFFEYALKGAIMLDDSDYMNVFNDAYRAVMSHVRNPSGHMYCTINMHNGLVAGTLLDSLSAFWPGLQISAGDIQGAIQSHLIYWQLWRKYSAMPEAFNILNKTSEWHGYPLRPEFVESTYHLYQATGDEFYLRVGERVLKDLHRRTWSRCGFAVLHDIHTGKREDRMESFMLSETLKYLYLLFDGPHPINRRDSNTVFTTEGHLLSAPRHSRLAVDRAAHRAEYKSSNLQCKVYEPYERRGLRTGIEGRPDYDFTAHLVDMPLLGNDGYWDEQGTCEVPIASRYDFEIMFTPDAPLADPGGSLPTSSPTDDSVVRVEGDIEIRKVLGLKGRVTLSEDGLHYELTSVGDLRVHRGQKVYIADTSVTPDAASDSEQGSNSAGSPDSKSVPPRKVHKARDMIDAEGRVTDVTVTILSDGRVVGEGVGSTATFGVNLLPRPVTHSGGVPEHIHGSAQTFFGIGKPPVRLMRPRSDPHGCAGTSYPIPWDGNQTVPWIAFVKRGSCSFYEKLSAARALSASGTIVWGPGEYDPPKGIAGSSANEEEMDWPDIRPSAYPDEDDLPQVSGVGMVYLGTKMGEKVDSLFETEAGHSSDQSNSSGGQLQVAFGSVNSQDEHDTSDARRAEWTSTEDDYVDVETEIGDGIEDRVGSKSSVDQVMQALLDHLASRGKSLSTKEAEARFQTLKEQFSLGSRPIGDSRWVAKQTRVERSAKPMGSAPQSSPVMRIAGLPIANLAFGR